MRLAPSNKTFARRGDHTPCRLKHALARGVRPAVGFLDPDDVVKDPHLSLRDKRHILSSWASDASAVEDEPQLRWLVGTLEPVRWEAVSQALLRLDALEARQGAASHEARQ